MFYSVLLALVRVDFTHILQGLYSLSGDVLPPDLVKSRNREIGCYNDRIALKFDKHIGSAAAEVLSIVRAIGKILNPNLALWQSIDNCTHYIDVIMTTMESQITSLTVVYSTVYSDADQRNHQSSASLAFVWGIRRDRWIPRTKGQLRGKCFHLMASSWISSVTKG